MAVLTGKELVEKIMAIEGWEAKLMYDRYEDSLYPISNVEALDPDTLPEGEEVEILDQMGEYNEITLTLTPPKVEE